MNSIGYTHETYAQKKHLMMMLALNLIPQPLYSAAFTYLKKKKAAEETVESKN
jgi:hypothetical protein